jgi:hypothetical protein
MRVGNLAIVNTIDRAASPVDADGLRTLTRDDLPPDLRTTVASFLGMRGVVLERGRYEFEHAVLYRDPVR